MAGAFDATAYDNTGYYTGAPVSPPVVPPYPGAGGGGRRNEPALIAPFITWGKKKKKTREEEVEEVAQAVEQVIIVSPDPLPDINVEAIAERLLEAKSLMELRRIKKVETFMSLLEREIQDLDDEEDLLLLS